MRGANVVMDNGIIIAIATSGGGLLVWFGNWLAGKRRVKVDVLQAEVKTMHEIVDTWKELAESLKLRVNDLEGLVGKLQTENTRLNKEVTRLEGIINKRFK